MRLYLALAAGSLAGAFSRYAVVGALDRVAPGLPYGIFVVNLAGCLVIGFCESLASARGLLSAEARVLLMTGFCGAFTTLSSLMLDSSRLLASGRGSAALLNIVLTVLGGAVCFRLGTLLGR